MLRIWRAQVPQAAPGENVQELSRDPQFIEKLVDVVGLYLSPPEHALVLCCDEKSQIRRSTARSQVCRSRRVAAGTMTHDYVRHGTATCYGWNCWKAA